MGVLASTSRIFAAGRSRGPTRRPARSRRPTRARWPAVVWPVWLTTFEAGRVGEAELLVEHFQVADDVRVVVSVDDRDRLPAAVARRAAETDPVEPVGVADLRRRVAARLCLRSRRSPAPAGSDAPSSRGRQQRPLFQRLELHRGSGKIGGSATVAMHGAIEHTLNLLTRSARSAPRNPPPAGVKLNADTCSPRRQNADPSTRGFAGASPIGVSIERRVSCAIVSGRSTSHKMRSA